VKTINCNNGWYLGLGDLICFAWLAAGCRATGEEIAWFATGWRAEVLRLLGVTSTDRSEDAEGSYLSVGGFEDALARGEKISYLEAMRREFGIAAAPVRPSPQFESSQERRVLLFPHTKGPSRQWPAAFWIELANLLQQLGYDPVVILQDRDPRYEGRVPFWMAALPYRELFSHIRSARLVISNDSGPAHLAGTLGVKTLVIAGPTGLPTFEHLPEVTVLNRDRPGSCTGCYYRGSYRPACEVGCRMLFELPPEAVIESVQRLLSEPAQSVPTLKRRKTK